MKGDDGAEQRLRVLLSSFPALKFSHQTAFYCRQETLPWIGGGVSRQCQSR